MFPLTFFFGSQLHGHRAAKLDPLNLAHRSKVSALDPRRYGFPLSSSLVREDFVSDVLPDASEKGDISIEGILDFPNGQAKGKKSIEEVAERLKEVYCEGVGYEVRTRISSLHSCYQDADCLPQPFQVHAPPIKARATIPHHLPRSLTFDPYHFSSATFRLVSP